jgi:hypothetical protein
VTILIVAAAKMPSLSPSTDIGFELTSEKSPCWISNPFEIAPAKRQRPVGSVRLQIRVYLIEEFVLKKIQLPRRDFVLMWDLDVNVRRTRRDVEQRRERPNVPPRQDRIELDVTVDIRPTPARRRVIQLCAPPIIWLQS